jgi:hypothetical protein
MYTCFAFIKKQKKDCSFDEKVIYLIVNQSIKYINNLIQNYKLIFKVLQINCANIESFKQIKTPKLSNLELAALNFTAEFMSNNTELQLFIVIKGTYFESKIERSAFNKRKRKFFDYIKKIRQCICIFFLCAEVCISIMNASLRAQSYNFFASGCLTIA